MTDLRTHADDDDDGRTPLYLTRKLRTFTVVTELGAHIYAKDDEDDGRTPLHWPRTTELLDVAKPLETDCGRATTQGE